MVAVMTSWYHAEASGPLKNLHNLLNSHLRFYWIGLWSLFWILNCIFFFGAYINRGWRIQIISHNIWTPYPDYCSGPNSNPWLLEFLGLIIWVYYLHQRLNLFVFDVCTACSLCTCGLYWFSPGICFHCFFLLLFLLFVLCNTHVLNNKNNPIVWCTSLNQSFSFQFLSLFFFLNATKIYPNFWKVN